MDKQQAAKEISDRLYKMQALLNACVKIADESGVGFDLPYGGEGTHQSGMGAYYSPEGDSQTWHDRTGWNPSAHSC